MAASMRRPIKALNAVWQIDVDETGTALVEILRHLDRDRVQTDVLVTSQYEGPYDLLIKELGAQIVLGKDHFRPGRNLRELADINNRYGPYDVVHIHRHQHFGGAPFLRAAHQLEIPVRVVHNHLMPKNDNSGNERTRMAVAGYLTKRHCTHGFAVTADSACSLFGPQWERDPRFDVLPPACDFSPFRSHGSRARIRSELGIADDEFALAHVSGFSDAGEQEFVLAIAFELKKHLPKYRVVMFGDGPLLHDSQHQVMFAGLPEHVLFRGLTVDLPAHLLAMDGFVFPSSVPAVSSATLKAQAAGLVCFLSEEVAHEVEIVPELIRRVPLDSGAAIWAQEIAAHCHAPLSQAQALEKCLASVSNVTRYVERVERVYASALAQDAAVSV